MSRFRNHPNYRWMALGIVMLGTFMAVLDSSIVNVALPHIMSSFGINRDQVEWVATAYMLATALAMPLVGWFTQRISYKMLYLASIAMFTIGSGLCAISWSSNILITARILQAAGGGAVQPLGIALLANLFEPHERGKAMGVWGMGIMLGPMIGPTLGGYLTDWFSWRSIFTVNLPLGVLTILLGMIVMDTHDESSDEPARFDLLGYGFLCMLLISALLGLSNGQEKGWDSLYVHITEIFSLIGLVGFLALEWSVKKPLLDLGLFQYRNYSITMALAVLRSLALFGGLFLLPIFLENLAGYSTIQTGLWMVPGAVAIAIAFPVAGYLADRMSTRFLAVIGVIFTGISLMLYGYLDPRSGWETIVIPQLLRGAGLGLMFAPVQTAALNAIPLEVVAVGSSFLAIAQRVGGAFGIAIINTYVTDMSQNHAVRIAAHLPANSMKMARLASRLGDLGMAHDAHGTISYAIHMFNFRSTVMSFQNGFVFTGILLIVLAGPLSMMLTSDIHSATKARESKTRPTADPAPDSDSEGIAGIRAG